MFFENWSQVKSRKVMSKINGEEKGMVDSPLMGEQPLFAKLGHWDLKNLTGRILTIIDASYSDVVQRKAVKDLVKKEIWFHWAPNLDLVDKEMPVGMPEDIHND